ncbi:MAG: hypothetical protein JSS47_04980 [Proteobacteria bacterium]|nr:hypothetical protein [Pseudomonadota bacterium]
MADPDRLTVESFRSTDPSVWLFATQNTEREVAWSRWILTRRGERVQ